MTLIHRLLRSSFSQTALHTVHASVNVQKFVADLQISGLLPEYF